MSGAAGAERTEAAGGTATVGRLRAAARPGLGVLGVLVIAGWAAVAAVGPALAPYPARQVDVIRRLVGGPPVMRGYEPRPNAREGSHEAEELTSPEPLQRR